MQVHDVNKVRCSDRTTVRKKDSSTAGIGFPELVVLAKGLSSEPKSLSLDTASKTRLAPIRLVIAADSVAARTPMSTLGAQTLMACIYV